MEKNKNNINFNNDLTYKTNNPTDTKNKMGYENPYGDDYYSDDNSEE